MKVLLALLVLGVTTTFAADLSNFNGSYSLLDGSKKCPQALDIEISVDGERNNITVMGGQHSLINNALDNDESLIQINDAGAKGRAKLSFDAAERQITYKERGRLRLREGGLALLPYFVNAKIKMLQEDQISVKFSAVGERGFLRIDRMKCTYQK